MRDEESGASQACRNRGHQPTESYTTQQGRKLVTDDFSLLFHHKASVPEPSSQTGLPQKCRQVAGGEAVRGLFLELQCEKQPLQPALFIQDIGHKRNQ